MTLACYSWLYNKETAPYRNNNRQCNVKKSDKLWWRLGHIMQILTMDGRRWMKATTTEYYHYQHFYRVEQLVYSNMCHPSSSLQRTIVRSHNDGRHKNMKYLKFYDKALIYHKLHHICPCGKIFSSSTFLPEYLWFLKFYPGCPWHQSAAALVHDACCW